MKKLLLASVSSLFLLVSAPAFSEGDEHEAQKAMIDDLDQELNCSVVLTLSMRDINTALIVNSFKFKNETPEGTEARKRILAELMSRAANLVELDNRLENIHEHYMIPMIEDLQVDPEKVYNTYGPKMEQTDKSLTLLKGKAALDLDKYMEFYTKAVLPAQRTCAAWIAKVEPLSKVPPKSTL